MQDSTEGVTPRRRRMRTLATLVVTVGMTWALAGCGAGTTTRTEARPVTNATDSPEPTRTSTLSEASTPSETPMPPGSPSPSTTPAAAATTSAAAGIVSHVVDGDTVDVAGVGRIRVIGIDTPESGVCGYEQANALMRQLVLGHTVTLTAAPAKDNADTYGRLLRYVDVAGVDAGLAEVQAGFATARYDSRDGYGAHPREASYVAADEQAPDYTCTPAPTATKAAAAPAGKAAADGAAVPERACDPAYPTVCIPPAPPDLDCKDVPYKRFTVKAPDPHRFDADHDGIGCE